MNRLTNDTYSLTMKIFEEFANNTVDVITSIISAWAMGFSAHRLTKFSALH